MEVGVSAQQPVTSVAHGMALLAEGMEVLPCASAAPLETAELLAVLRGLKVVTRKSSAVNHQV